MIGGLKALGGIVAATLVVLVLCAATPATASASCDTIQSRGGYDLVFFKLHMKCGTAKHYAKKLMRDGSYDPRGFDCKRQNPDNGGCTSTRRANKFFIFYTPDRLTPKARRSRLHARMRA